MIKSGLYRTGEWYEYYIEDRLVGDCKVILLWDEMPFIESLEVEEANRNKGIGKTILSNIIEDYSHCPGIMISADVDNSRAIKLYESFGFKKIGALSWPKCSDVFLYIDNTLKS